MNLLIDVLVGLLIGVLVFLLSAFVLGLIGIGAPVPSILGLLAALLYIFDRRRRL